MIIVSQDETSIINFDNIEKIYVSWKFISVNYSLNNNECIAEYKTEERAKEVLQEIVKATIENKKAEETKDMFGFSIITADTYYQMPKE